MRSSKNLVTCFDLFVYGMKPFLNVVVLLQYDLNSVFSSWWLRDFFDNTNSECVVVVIQVDVGGCGGGGVVPVVCSTNAVKKIGVHVVVLVIFQHVCALRVCVSTRVCIYTARNQNKRHARKKIQRARASQSFCTRTIFLVG